MSSSSTSTCRVCGQGERSHARGSGRAPAAATGGGLTGRWGEGHLGGQRQLKAAKVLEVVLRFDERDARVVVRAHRRSDLTGQWRSEEAHPDVRWRDGLREQAVDLRADCVPGPVVEDGGHGAVFAVVRRVRKLTTTTLYVI